MNKSLNAVLLRWADSSWAWFPFGRFLPPTTRTLPAGMMLRHALSWAVLGGFGVLVMVWLLFHSWRPGAFALGAVFGLAIGLVSALMLAWAWNCRARALTAVPAASAAGSGAAAPVETVSKRTPLTVVERYVVQPLLLVAIAATGLLVVRAVENVRGALALRSFRAEQLARGESTSFRDALPQPVPDALNFAMTPLLRPLLDYQVGVPGGDPRDHSIHWQDSNGLARAQAVKVEHARGRRETTWIDGSPTDLEMWQAYFRSDPTWPSTAQPQSAGRDVLLALSRWDAEMRELREAASTRSESRFPVRYEDGFSALLPHLAPLRNYARILALRGTAALNENRPAEALGDVLLAFRLGDAMAEEPILVSLLVRVAIDLVALQPVWEGCLEHRWTDAQLVELQNCLSSKNYRTNLLRALRGERALADNVYEDLMRRGASTIEMYGVLGDNDLTWTFLRWIPPGWIRQNQVVHGRYLQEIIDNVEQGPSYQVATQGGDRFEQLVDKQSPMLALVAMLAPSVQNSIVKVYEAEARRNLALVGLALERHRLATGAYPDNLGALTPRFLAQLPVDPMNGQPLHYARTAAGDYHLYSVGRDGKDDEGRRPAGKVKDPDIRLAPLVLAPGDLVWR